MPDIENVKTGLKEIANDFWMYKRCDHYQNICRDALTVIESQQRHIAELHHGIEALRDAMKGEAKNG